MELSDAMLQRRSVRKYTAEDVPDEKLRRVLEAGLLAPSSMNRKPCELYVVRDKETLKRLSRAKKAGSAFLADAPVAIAVVADANKADTWVEDCSIVMTQLWLAAVSEGLGACWCQLHLRADALGRDAEQNALAVLGAPEGSRMVGVLGLGFAVKEPKAHSAEDVDWGKVRGWEG